MLIRPIRLVFIVIYPFSEPTEEDSLLLVNEDEAEKKAHRKSLALQVSIVDIFN